MAPVFSKEIVGFFVTYMDFPTLLAFRLTSRRSLQLVRKELHTHLHQIISAFVPNPSFLLSKLDTHGAFIGGSVALQFFLRETDVDPKNLDIYLPYDTYPPLFHHMFAHQGGMIHFGARSIASTPHILADRVVTFTTPLGTVTLWLSDAHTPFLPIVCEPTSAHFLYVNSTHFGCAYPNLLFQRRAIAGNPRIAGFDDAVAKCKSRNIDLRLSAHMWTDLAHEGSCAANFFNCPAQARTFTDPGSLRGRMHPLRDVEVDPGVVWRLDYRPCGGGCAQPNDALPIPRLLQNLI